MNCPTCDHGVCTNGCTSRHREPELADRSIHYATAAASGHPGQISRAVIADIALLEAHIPHLHPGRLEAAERTLEQLRSHRRRYDDRSGNNPTRRAA